MPVSVIEDGARMVEVWLNWVSLLSELEAHIYPEAYIYLRTVPLHVAHSVTVIEY